VGVAVPLDHVNAVPLKGSTNTAKAVFSVNSEPLGYFWQREKHHLGHHVPPFPLSAISRSRSALMSASTPTVALAISTWVWMVLWK
jgi:hypothetical protein